MLNGVKISTRDQCAIIKDLSRDVGIGDGKSGAERSDDDSEKKMDDIAGKEKKVKLLAKKP